jgi:hypothetical protein
MVEQKAEFEQRQTKGKSDINELKFKKKLAFIFRNWKFDKCRDDLLKKQVPGNEPGKLYVVKDLDRAASEKEEKFMTELFTEYYGI